MQAKKNLWMWFVLISLVLESCSTEQGKAGGLYDIDSLIATQIDYLIAHGSTIRKKATLNGTGKTTTAAPKTITAWKNELAIFSELNAVNKPTNKLAYAIQEYADSKSNLRVKSFNTREDLPVKYLKIYYQRSPDKIRKIEAQYNESNSLYSSTRFLTMEFEDIVDKTVLTSYSIKGGQKMLLDDSVQYSVDVSLILKH